MGVYKWVKPTFVLIILAVVAFSWGSPTTITSAATSASLPTPTSGWHAGWGSPGVSGRGNATQVHALAASGNNIYVGGNFTTAGGHNANNIAVWNSATQTWDVLGSTSAPQGNGTNGVVRAIAVLPNGNLIVGGEFTRVYNSPTSSIAVTNLAAFNPTTQQWFALGGAGENNNGVNGPVHAIAVMSNDVFYVGGSFSSALNNGSSLTVNNLVRWQFGIAIGSNGTWHRLGDATGNGANGLVRALFWETTGLGSGNLFVGGDFTSVANGAIVTSVGYTAQWIVPSIGSPTWAALGTGTNGSVYAITRFVGGDGHLYVGGDFSEAGGVANALNIAYWTGATWQKLGTGALAGSNGPVYALENLGIGILAGGEFTRVYDASTGINRTSMRVSLWTGSNWNALGDGAGDQHTNGVAGYYVTALLDGPLGYYVGGTFHTAQNDINSWIPVASIARFYPFGAEWVSLAPTNITTLGTNNRASLSQPGVAGLLVRDGTLYATGTFTGLGNTATSGLGMFSSGNWQLMGGPSTNSGYANNGVFGEGRGLAWDSANNRLLTVGNFSYACNGPSGIASCASAGSVALWTPGTGFSGVTSDQFGAGVATHIAFSGVNTFYVGGQFTALPGGSANSANYVAYYNGTAYQRLGSDISATGNGLNAIVGAMVWDANNSRLIVGGSFTTAYDSNGSPVTVNRLAYWTGSGWHALGGGANGNINALLIQGNYLYVGGSFTQVGGSLPVNGIARFNLQTETWEAIGSGSQPGVLGTLFPSGGTVLALAIHNDYLYVGGEFSAVQHNGQLLAANNFARVDLFTMAWEGYGDGPQSSEAKVYAIAVDPTANRVYVGGFFGTAGGVPASHVVPLTPSATPIPGLVVMRTGSDANFGIVTSDLAGIDCKGILSVTKTGCTTGFSQGAQITLTASVSAAGKVFNGWGGACAASGLNPTCTLTINGDTYVTADFVTGVTLTINKSGDGNGTITSPAGIDCGSTCVVNLTAGTSVTLTATPNASSFFVHWTGVSCTGGNTSPTCQFTINSNTTVNALFNPNRLTVNISALGGSEGTVTSNPPGITCSSSSCFADYPIGTQITLTAAPNIGSKFDGWGGVCTGQPGLQCTFNLTAAMVAEANFGIAPHLVYLPLLQR